MHSQQPLSTLELPAVTLHGSPTEYDEMTSWNATLTLADTSDHTTDARQVVGGRAEFVTLRLEGQPVSSILDSQVGAEHFVPLFDDAGELIPAAEQFDAILHDTALFLTDAEIEPALRGHRLGAWMVAEIIAMMARSNTFIGMYPFPLDLPRSGPEREAAIATGAPALHQYWQKTGVEPITAAPLLLGASTAYPRLRDARDQLRPVADVAISVPANRIVDGYPQPPHRRLSTSIETAT